MLQHVDGHGIPLDRVLAGANRHDSLLLAAHAGRARHVEARGARLSLMADFGDELLRVG